MQLFGDKCYSGIQWRWNCKALCGFLHRFPIFQCSGVVGRALGQKSEVLGLVPGFATFQLCDLWQVNDFSDPFSSIKWG